MLHRFRAFATITAVTIVLFLVPGPVAGQIIWPKDTPKIPQARTWLQQKAKLPPYSPPRTPDGVPDLQGNWGSAVRGGNDDIEEHDWVDVTTPPQESFIFDPADEKIPYTPWGAGSDEASPASAADSDPYANERWEAACHEGNHEHIAGLAKLGFRWFSGVTPPK